MVIKIYMLSSNCIKFPIFNVFSLVCVSLASKKNEIGLTLPKKKSLEICDAIHNNEGKVETPSPQKQRK